MKKGALFCLKGFIREPKPTKKGIRVLLGILEGKPLQVKRRSRIKVRCPEWDEVLETKASGSRCFASAPTALNLQTLNPKP